MPDPQFIRVKLKATKAHISIVDRSFNEQLHVRLKQPAVDRFGKPLPPKYPTKYPSSPASPGDAEGEAAPTATTPHEANKEAKP